MMSKVCTWEDLQDCRGYVWKNKKSAAGPDLLMIDGRHNSPLIVGVDCKSLHKNVHQIATQFIQCLASHPHVAVVFSIRYRHSASYMHNISNILTPQQYQRSYSELKTNFPYRYGDTDYDSLFRRVFNEVGVIPQHVLMGVEFFGPTVSNLMKVYFGDSFNDEMDSDRI
ncbi:hypothetical protein GEMRC1_008112 [Eukaryota sp. GEM-RC1]